MTQQLKELAEQTHRLQQVVKMISDNLSLLTGNVSELHRTTNRDILSLTDAVADLNDHVEKRERLLNDLCDDVMKLKARV